MDLTTAKKTEHVTDQQDIWQQLVELVSSARKSCYICLHAGTLDLPGNEELLVQTVGHLTGKNVKSRIVTQINDTNFSKIRKLTAICDVRHIDHSIGDIVVVDDAVWGSVAPSKSGDVYHLVRTDLPSLVEQQRYFFDTLWDHAIPAAQRLAEIEKGLAREVTEVIVGTEEVARRVLNSFKNISKRLDVCYGSPGLSVIANSGDILESGIDFVKRGGKIRFITEISKENISYCKSLMNIQETRHLDGILGNFAVTERDYVATSTLFEAHSIPQMIYSTSSQIVKQHQYLFETLWSKAIPAELKIREIEEGIPAERTEVWYDTEEIIAKTVKCISQVKKGIDLCGDRDIASVNLAVDGIKDEYRKLVERGGKIRLVTEITKDNLHYLREFMKVGDVRHLAGIKGNFGVTELDYIASATNHEATPRDQVVYSTVRPFVQQQQFLFETLWEKAMSAEQRIREIEQGIPPQVTDVHYGREAVIERSLQFLSCVKHTLDLCGDSNGPAAILAAKPIHDGYIALHDSGIRVRHIVEITKENVDLAKKMIEFGEVRHLDGLKGYFAICDSTLYASNIPETEGGVLSQMIISSVKGLVEQQQYFFNTLWQKAMPAQERIKLIEEGKEPEKIELLTDTSDSINRAFNVMTSTRTELLVLFATPNNFALAMKMEPYRFYKSIIERGGKVRILVPRGEGADDAMEKLAASVPGIEIRLTDSNLNTRLTIMISDRNEFMIWEIRDDDTYDPIKAGGVATYSNFKSLASSYGVIFDNLWMLTTFSDELRAANTNLERNENAMKDFINIAAHEMRTPLQPILGLSEILRDTLPELSSDNRDQLDGIVRNAKRLEQLQNDILDATRIEGRVLKLRKGSVNLSSIIKSAIHDFEPRFAEKGIRLTFQGDADVNLVADGGRITQVISNLLSNAIKFTDSGDEVVVKVTLDSKAVTVSVIDSGRGIDKAILPRLFTKFATHSDSGTGLGLYISKGIIEAHGGKMWAENSPDGKGASFSFLLPHEAR